jgi:thiosulfate dehydrogenase
MKKFIGLVLIIAISVLLVTQINSPGKKEKLTTENNADSTAIWIAPDLQSLTAGPETDLIIYGRKLIENTSYYLGPRGTVGAMSNGLNCQNCHLDAGTRLNSNCLAGVATSYPKFRNRSGKLENIEFRINECMERSLNGVILDSNSREMKAMKAYMLWLGKDYKPKKEYNIAGTGPLPFIKRAADTTAGKLVFQSRCTSCHGLDGLGLYMEDSTAYKYPPLWGPHSYNVSAGMYTLTKLAGFIKYNMPYSATPLAPQLTDEECWDVAAFINSRQRPDKQFAYDWPDISKKPVDFPFGPYADSFSVQQHKYGPFEEIARAKQKK